MTVWRCLLLVAGSYVVLVLGLLGWMVTRPDTRAPKGRTVQRGRS